MARKVKCPYCGEQLNKEEAHEYKKRYYHQECFDKWQQEKIDRRELIGYVCNLYDLEAPTGMILKQIKDFHEYGYTYKGMELALRYFYEVLGNVPQEDSQGIGIIPYIYEEAKQSYITKLKVEESIKNYKQEEPEVVRIHSPKPTYEKKVNLIDIGSL